MELTGAFVMHSLLKLNCFGSRLGFIRPFAEFCPFIDGRRLVIGLEKMRS
jgi:hypothetical protein